MAVTKAMQGMQGSLLLGLGCLLTLHNGLWGGGADSNRDRGAGAFGLNAGSPIAATLGVEAPSRHRRRLH